MPRTLLSAARAPLAWLLVVAVAFLILLGLEHTGAASGPVTLNTHNTSSQSQSKGEDKSKEDKQKKDKHCKDGKGKDDKHNKHCHISHN
jgi:hypothetical protein